MLPNLKDAIFFYWIQETLFWHITGHLLNPDIFFPGLTIIKYLLMIRREIIKAGLSHLLAPSPTINSSIILGINDLSFVYLWNRGFRLDYGYPSDNSRILNIIRYLTTKKSGDKFDNFDNLRKYFFSRFNKIFLSWA